MNTKSGAESCSRAGSLPQLDLFSYQSQVDNMVIDRALNFVTGQQVLRRLLAGKSWSHAFGMGGSTHPVMWQGGPTGIEIQHGQQKRLIKPAQILARAKLYTTPKK